MYSQILGRVSRKNKKNLGTTTETIAHFNDGFFCFFNPVQGGSCALLFNGGRAMDYSLDSKKKWKKVLRPLVRQKFDERNIENRSFEAFILIGSILLAALFILFGATCKPANAAVSEEKAVMGIIGEAEDQGYQGMLAVACAIRNRNSLKGVYGVNSPRVKNHKYSKNTYQLAQKAWQESKNCDVTRGATHWENTKAFGAPSWAKNMTLCYEYKDHRFYKEVRHG